MNNVMLHEVEKVRNYLLIVLLISVSTIYISCNESSAKQKSSKPIVVEADISKYFYRNLHEVFDIRDEIKLRVTPYYDISYAPPIETISGRVINGKIRWVINTDKLTKVMPPMGEPLLMNPGDTLHVTYIGDSPIYSGKDKNAISLLNTLMKTHEQLILPKKINSYNVATLEEYKEWNEYLDKLLVLNLPVIESYKNKISPEEYQYYKAITIGGIENNRVRAFNALMNSVHRGYPGLTYSELLQIWDSTQYNPSRLWLKSLDSYNGLIYDYYSFIRIEICRKLNFNFNLDSLNSPDLFTNMLYKYVKENYHGLMRERLLTFILKERAIKDLGVKNPMAQKMLKDYYSLPGFPEYKKWVKEYEEKALKKQIRG